MQEVDVRVTLEELKALIDHGDSPLGYHIEGAECDRCIDDVLFKGRLVCEELQYNQREVKLRIKCNCHHSYDGAPCTYCGKTVTDKLMEEQDRQDKLDECLDYIENVLVRAGPEYLNDAFEIGEEILKKNGRY